MRLFVLLVAIEETNLNLRGKRQCGTDILISISFSFLCVSLADTTRFAMLLPADCVLDVTSFLDYDDLVALQFAGKFLYGVVKKNSTTLPVQKTFTVDLTFLTTLQVQSIFDPATLTLCSLMRPSISALLSATSATTSALTKSVSQNSIGMPSTVSSSLAHWTCFPLLTVSNR